jgi:hypothetical protein
MTNEEAKNFLQSRIKLIDKYYPQVEDYREALDIAIKALETASCIKEKCAYCPHCEHCDVDDETLAIKALEQTRWIPCSERLPEEVGVYLVSMNRLGYPRREVDGFVCGRWERFGSDVIAWCEIPQPYKAESEDKE